MNQTASVVPSGKVMAGARGADDLTAGAGVASLVMSVGLSAAGYCQYVRPTSMPMALKQAKEIAEAYGRRHGAVWIPGEQVVERERYWFLPLGYVGSSGVIVDKITGHLTVLGSALAMDDQFWAYERGFLAGSVTLRVNRVHERERTLQVLQRAVSGSFRWAYERRDWLKKELETLPAEFREQDLGLVAPLFRNAEESGWFEFEVEPNDPSAA